MLDAVRAEFLKFSRHRATWFLVWIYPIGFLILFAIAVAVSVSKVMPDSGTQSAAAWIGHTAAVWYVPPNTIGRYLIAAFTAVVFAGEYGWNTWKLVVPHRARSVLILAKYLLVVALLYAAFVLTGVLTVALSWIGDQILGDLPKGVEAGAILKEHGVRAAVTVAPVLLTIAYTSLAAVLTRSMLAAVVIAIVVGTAEQTFTSFAPLLSVYAPRLIWGLYQVLPGYHLDNLASWIAEGHALAARFPRTGTVALGWATSAAAIAAWIAGLALLTLGSFRRQDIN
jgi:ABC-2 type transport system permease protein